MEEIKLEISLLDQNSKNYLSNEMKKWNRLTTKSNTKNLILMEFNSIEDTSYLDSIIERLKVIIDDEPIIESEFIKFPKLKYLNDDEFYNMIIFDK